MTCRGYRSSPNPEEGPVSHWWAREGMFRLPPRRRDMTSSKSQLRGSSGGRDAISLERVDQRKVFLSEALLQSEKPRYLPFLAK